MSTLNCHTLHITICTNPSQVVILVFHCPSYPSPFCSHFPPNCRTEEASPSRPTFMPSAVNSKWYCAHASYPAALKLMVRIHPKSLVSWPVCWGDNSSEYILWPLFPHHPVAKLWRPRHSLAAQTHLQWSNYCITPTLHLCPRWSCDSR